MNGNSGGNRGGKRPGAGRPRKDAKVDLQIQKKCSDMLKAKAQLLHELHDPELIKEYKRTLKEMFKSKRMIDRRDAIKIMTDVILKTDVPKELEEAKPKGVTLGEMLQEIDRKRQEQYASGDPEMVSDREDGFPLEGYFGGNDSGGSQALPTGDVPPNRES